MKYGDKKIRDIHEKIKRSHRSHPDIKRLTSRMNRARLNHQLRKAVLSEDYDDLVNTDSQNNGRWFDRSWGNWQLWKNYFIAKTEELPAGDRSAYFRSLFKRYSPLVHRRFRYHDYENLIKDMTLLGRFRKFCYLSHRRQQVKDFLIEPLIEYLCTKSEDKNFWSVVFSKMKHTDSIKYSKGRWDSLRTEVIAPYLFPKLSSFDNIDIANWLNKLQEAYNTFSHIKLEIPITYYAGPSYNDGARLWHTLTRAPNPKYHPEWIQSLITYLFTREDFIDFIEAYEAKQQT